MNNTHMEQELAAAADNPVGVLDSGHLFASVYTGRPTYSLPVHQCTLYVMAHKAKPAPLPVVVEFYKAQTLPGGPVTYTVERVWIGPVEIGCFLGENIRAELARQIQHDKGKEHI